MSAGGERQQGGKPRKAAKAEKTGRTELRPEVEERRAARRAARRASKARVAPGSVPEAVPKTGPGSGPGSGSESGPASALAASDAATPDDVRACYRWLLGRAPESDAAVEAHLADAPTPEGLRRRVLASLEFRQAVGAPVPPGLPADAVACPISFDADAAQVEEMLTRTRRSWMRLGDTAPHWSVLQEERFRPKDFAAHARDFWASGRQDRLRLEGTLARLRLGRPGIRRLVEFGCGVGRVTLHLAAIAPEVTAVDVSAQHLALAREQAKARGMDHIRFLRARPNEAMPVEPCDLWYSRRTLHLNPPPVIRHLLWLGFATVAPGGLAVFQLLTHGFDYAFDLGAYLAEAPAAPGPEMHVLPQPEVFALAAAAGLQVVEVQEDPIPGLDRKRWLSHVFVLRRPA